MQPGGALFLARLSPGLAEIEALCEAGETIVFLAPDSSESTGHGVPTCGRGPMFFTAHWAQGDNAVKESVDNVVKTFLAMDDAEVIDLNDSKLQKGKKFFDTAVNFIVEWQLRSWVSLQNQR